MKQVTTLQIGGPASKFVTVTTEQELVDAIAFAKDSDLNYMVIGGGSNLLVSDEGVDCLIIKNEIKGINNVILNKAERSEESIADDKVVLKVKSGTTLQDLVDYSIENGLTGLQNMTGIPGTVGGAVYGNAGAYGQNISDHLLEVKIFDGNNIVTFTKDKCRFNYRDSIFKTSKDTILEVVFELMPFDKKSLQKESTQTLEKRLIKYPKGIRCPGSFFKNIIADTLPQEILGKVKDKVVYGKVPAGALLESVGAKGNSFEGIQIAPYHANLFINTGTGTAKAFVTLAEKYVNLVKEKYGITLEPEVQLTNLPGIL